MPPLIVGVPSTVIMGCIGAIFSNLMWRFLLFCRVLVRCGNCVLELTGVISFLSITGGNYKSEVNKHLSLRFFLDRLSGLRAGTHTTQ